jgi:hypothetical protein
MHKQFPARRKEARVFPNRPREGLRGIGHLLDESARKTVVEPIKPTTPSNLISPGTRDSLLGSTGTITYASIIQALANAYGQMSNYT